MCGSRGRVHSIYITDENQATSRTKNGLSRAVVCVRVCESLSPNRTRNLHISHKIFSHPKCSAMYRHCCRFASDFSRFHHSLALLHPKR